MNNELMSAPGCYTIRFTMNIARQLFQLQEIDLELESTERTINHITSQIGESQAVLGSRNRLAREQQHLEELTHQQRSLEWEIDDFSTKLKSAEKELYSGRIRIPKELSNLQNDIENMKTRRRQLEDKALDIMEQVELARKGIARHRNELEALEAEWQSQQKDLLSELEQLKINLASLQQDRQSLVAGTDRDMVDFYQAVKKKKGIAVARVNQGTCGGCRISLPVSELQQARTGALITCSSCGRILYLP
jgi:predicted  nucleic acid-binding Zn-ribbon protein